MKEGDFYGHSVRRITANETQAERALQILAWILCARRPIKIEEMRYAAAIVSGNYSMNFAEFLSEDGDIVDCCEGLVVVLPESGTVAFAHPTVSEFLESGKNQIFSMDPEVVIARTCLTYLASDYLQKDLRGVLENPRKLDLLWYAGLTWADHVRSAEETNVLDFIINLFKRNLRLVFITHHGWWNHWESSSYKIQDERIRASIIEAYFKCQFEMKMDSVWIASKVGLANTVKKLLNFGCILNRVIDSHSLFMKTEFGEFVQEPLLTAAWGGHLQVVKVLLEAGADANARDRGSTERGTGMTALHIAASHTPRAVSLQLIKILLNGGADLEAADLNGRTPLHCAAYYHKVGVAKLLLKKGANIDARDADGDTPLHKACTPRRDPERLFSVLLECGADFNSKNDDGETAVHTVSKNSSLKILKLLLEKDVDINAIDKKGQTALYIATNRSDQAKAGLFVHALLAKGANIEARDNKGRTPLNNAAYRGQVDVVKILLARGADIDVKSIWGQRPLECIAIARARARRAKPKNAIHKRDGKWDKVAELLQEAEKRATDAVEIHD
jgi:ankyrin repeat protein